MMMKPLMNNKEELEYWRDRVGELAQSGDVVIACPVIKTWNPITHKWDSE